MSGNLTRKEWIAVVAVALVCCFVAGFGTGRNTAPVRTVERQVVAESQQHAEVSKVATSAEVRVETREVVRWRDRVVVKPDGTRIETHEAQRDDGKSTERVKAAEASQQVVTVQERVVVHEKLVEGPKLPGWSMGAAVGSGLDLRPRYLGEVGRRLVGGLWGTLVVDVPARAALVGLRLEFGR